MTRICTNLFSVDLDVGDVVLKHGGDVDLGELVLAEHDEETRLPASSIADDHQLFPDGCHFCTGGKRHILSETPRSLTNQASKVASVPSR